MPPGNPALRLPPEGAPVVSEVSTPHELCEPRIRPKMVKGVCRNTSCRHRPDKERVGAGVPEKSRPAMSLVSIVTFICLNVYPVIFAVTV